MRVERLIYSILVLAAAVFAIVQWRRAVYFEAENIQLAARMEALEAGASEAAGATKIAQAAAERLRKQTSELMQLRNEVTQLHAGEKAAEGLAAENQRLKSQLEQLAAANSAAASAGTNGNGSGRAAHFPRENWAFAGYGSPEAALVSAIWSMKEGNPQSYLDSLSPREQERIAPLWQNKSEAEIAEKHKNDVSTISGLRVLEREAVSANEVVMNVYLEGPGRVEKIRMNQVGQDWKFGGFIRAEQ